MEEEWEEEPEWARPTWRCDSAAGTQGSGAGDPSGCPGAALLCGLMVTKLRISSEGCSKATTNKALASQPLVDQPLTSQQLVNIHQAITNLSQLLQEVVQGQEVVIARSRV